MAEGFSAGAPERQDRLWYVYWTRLTMASPSHTGSVPPSTSRQLKRYHYGSEGRLMSDHTRRCAQPYTCTERSHILFRSILEGERFVTSHRFPFSFLMSSLFSLRCWDSGRFSFLISSHAVYLFLPV